jgi:hypothetical protein
MTPFHAIGARLTWLTLVVAGFSFWFFVAVPFASHRETYGWLASVYQQNYLEPFGWTLGKTWRPLAQVATWIGVALLDATIFPTSVPRQALLQGLIYLTFVFAWALLFSLSPHPRTLAIAGLVTGAVFFPGYIHLFHIYGHSYSAVLIMLALMLRTFFQPEWFARRETLLATLAVVLTLWHPFATLLFLGFYFGRYVETFTVIDSGRHLRAWITMGVIALAVALPIVLSPNLGVSWSYSPWSAFLISYKTNEINAVASSAALALAVFTAMTLPVSSRTRLLVATGVVFIGLAALVQGLPVLLVWISTAIAKLILRRSFGLTIALLTTVFLPYAGRIGGPVYGLFPIALTAFVTALDCPAIERRLQLIHTRYLVVPLMGLLLIVVALRVDMRVPLVSAAARPLLAERERTYQLEHALAWLGASPYCAHDLTFGEASGSPIESVESALIRRHRPPAALEDVLPFWNVALRCKEGDNVGRVRGVAAITFGGQTANGRQVFEVEGRYAGPTAVWIQTP